MPIKFRCVHCGQYLGISHTKAGTVVDCPACGRSVGVPQKDGGKAERVGRPSLNHQDSQLAEALREVAAIAHSSEIVLPQLPPAERGTDGRETREVHAPPPKVITPAPLPPLERIDPPARRASYRDEFYADPNEPTALDTRMPLEQLAAMGALERSESTRESSPSSYGTFPGANDAPWRLWLAFVAVGFTAIITGFVLGRWDMERESKKAGKTTSDPAAEQNLASGDNTYSHLSTLAVEGTIQYSEGGKSRPDAGAWVYAFPLTNETGKKLKPEWFQSDDVNRVQLLRILGGNAVQADKKGQFQLNLIRKGKYLLLLSSAHKSPATTQNDADSSREDLLRHYFEDYKAMLSQKAIQFKNIEFTDEPQKQEFDF